MTVRKKIAAFSLRNVEGLLRLAAYAKAAQRHTAVIRTRYSEYYDWNIIVGAITGEPGYAEISQDVKAMEVEQKKIYEQLVVQSFAALIKGPYAYVAFLEKVDADRQADMDSIEIVYRSAKKISDDITGNLTTAVRACAAIKLLSTIVVAATPVGLTFAGAGAASIVGTGWVAFGFSVTKSLAKDMSEARNSGVIAFDVSKQQDPVHVGKKAGDLAAEKVVKKMEERIEKQSGMLEEAEKKIAELSRAVARKVSARKLANAARRIGETEARATGALRGIKWAAGASVAARMFQIAFAAHDIYEGWEDYEKEWNGGIAHQEESHNQESHTGVHGLE